MTQKNILLALGIIAAFFVLTSDIGDALFLFIFVGAIPGTNYSLPPLVMLAILGVAIVALTHWVAVRQLYPGSPRIMAAQKKRRSVRAHKSASVSPRRRRYSQLEA